VGALPSSREGADDPVAVRPLDGLAHADGSGSSPIVLLEVDAIAEHDGTVERQPRLRTVPCDEPDDRMVVSTLPLAEVRLFRTAALACSRSGSAKTRFGGFFARDFNRDLVMGDGLLSIARQLHRHLARGWRPPLRPKRQTS